MINSHQSNLIVSTRLPSVFNNDSLPTLQLSLSLHVLYCRTREMRRGKKKKKAGDIHVCVNLRHTKRFMSNGKRSGLWAPDIFYCRTAFYWHATASIRLQLQTEAVCWGVPRAVEVDVSLTARYLLLSSIPGLFPAAARHGSIPPGIGFHIPEAEMYTWVTFIDWLRP